MIFVCRFSWCPLEQTFCRVHPVLIQVDEQSTDEGIPPQMCHQIVGLLLGKSINQCNHVPSIYFCFHYSQRKTALPRFTSMSVLHWWPTSPDRLEQRKIFRYANLHRTYVCFKASWHWCGSMHSHSLPPSLSPSPPPPPAGHHGVHSEPPYGTVDQWRRWTAISRGLQTQIHVCWCPRPLNGHQKQYIMYHFFCTQ